MKKTDIAMIVLIAAISITAAFFLTQKLLGDQKETVRVKTIDAVESGLEKPDPKIFNSNAINPSVEVQIKPSDQ